MSASGDIKWASSGLVLKKWEVLIKEDKEGRRLAHATEQVRIS